MKTQTLSTRVDENLVNRLSLFEAQTGVEKASLVRAALNAALDFYEQNGSLTFPLFMADATQRPMSMKSEAMKK